MFHLTYFAVAVGLSGFFFLTLTIGLTYFHRKRQNFILQTRSPHLLSIISIATLALTSVWSANEIYFASVGRNISPYLLACMGHLLLPMTVLPLMFRGLAFHIMFDAGMRKKYIRFIRKKMSLIIMIGTIILWGLIPYTIHIFTHTAYFDGDVFGSQLFYGEWRYFLAQYVVSIILLSVQLWQLTSVKKLTDAVGIISELKVVLGATIVFTLIYFPWLIALENGVKVGSLTDDEIYTWMRLNYVILAYQYVVWSYTIGRQLVAVWQHIRHTLKTAALYDASNKWMHPRGQVVSKIRVPGGVSGKPMSGGVHPTTGSGVSRVTTGVGIESHSNPPSLIRPISGPTASPSREHSPRLSWANKYSPKVSRHNSPRNSTNEYTGFTLTFAHSPKASSNVRSLSSGSGGGGGGGGTSSGGVVGSHSHNLSAELSLHGGGREPRLQTLRDILRHPIGREMFAEYAARHLTLESVMFYAAVEDYENHTAWAGLELRPVYDLGCQLYATFVATGSEYEINIDGNTKRDLKKIFAAAPPPSSTTNGSGGKAGKKRRSKQLQIDVAEAGTGTGTGKAAQAQAQAQAQASKSNPQQGRFEAFLSLPAASRRELYRHAQDEVYQLLKVNLYLPFYATAEFQNLRRAFEKELNARKAAAALAAQQAVAVGQGVGPSGSLSPTPNSTPSLSTTTIGGVPVITSDAKEGPPTHHFLRTPSPMNPRRIMTPNGERAGGGGGPSLLATPTGSGSSSLTTSPSTVNLSRNIHLRVDASPHALSRSTRRWDPCGTPVAHDTIDEGAVTASDDAEDEETNENAHTNTNMQPKMEIALTPQSSPPIGLSPPPIIRRTSGLAHFVGNGVASSDAPSPGSKSLVELSEYPPSIAIIEPHPISSDSHVITAAAPHTPRSKPNNNATNAMTTITHATTAPLLNTKTPQSDATVTPKKSARK